VKTGIQEPEGKIWIPASLPTAGRRRNDRPFWKEIRTTLDIDAECLKSAAAISHPLE